MNRLSLAAFAAVFVLLTNFATPSQAHERCRRQPVRNTARWFQEHRPVWRAFTAPARAIRARRCGHHIEHRETHHIEHHHAQSSVPPALSDGPVVQLGEACDCQPCTCLAGECRCPDCPTRVATAVVRPSGFAAFNVQDDVGASPRITAEQQRDGVAGKMRLLMRLKAWSPKTDRETRREIREVLGDHDKFEAVVDEFTARHGDKIRGSMEGATDFPDWLSKLFAVLQQYWPFIQEVIKFILTLFAEQPMAACDVPAAALQLAAVAA